MLWKQLLVVTGLLLQPWAAWATVDCPEGFWASSHWGCSGGSWHQHAADSPFVDWSFAGYEGGHQDIPDVPVAYDVVKDFGARGDNVTDDTTAFHRAIQQLGTRSQPGALYIPPGVYILTQNIEITRSMVLRGAGQGRTILRFPKSLTEIYGNSFKAWGVGASDYSWGGAFISANGKLAVVEKKPLSSIAKEATRGSTTLVLTTARGVKPGGWLAVRQSHTASKGALSHHLYGGLLQPVPAMGGPATDMLLFMSKVKQVDMRSGKVVLHRPLPFDIRPEWGADASLFEPKIQNVGIESLTIEFPHVKYGGDKKEAGWNALWLNRAANCWIRDVHIHNADNAIMVRQSHFNTIKDIQITSDDREPDKRGRAKTPARSRMDGHVGIGAKGGSGNLFANWTIKSMMLHDVIVDAESGSVFDNGTAVDLRANHHRGQPFAILWSNVDAGAGTRFFHWKGPKKLGSHSAAYTTLYNIRSKTPLDFFSPAQEYGPKLNLIGLSLSRRFMRANSGALVTRVGPDFGQPFHWNVEDIPQGKTIAQLQPQSLYQAMVQLRKAKEAGHSVSST